MILSYFLKSMLFDIHHDFINYFVSHSPFLYVISTSPRISHTTLGKRSSTVTVNSMRGL